MSDLVAWLLEQIAWTERQARMLDEDANASGQGPLVRVVMAECEAKRRIMEEVVPAVDGLDGAVQNEFWISSDGPYDYTSDLLLRLLALPYADRPGYDESWRP